MTGTKKPLVREVNPHLICVLCNGYFIEATTIVECLHTFCRSCLIKYLEKNKFCPICDVQLHKNNPLLSVRCDPTLQRLVYKLVPGLYAREMARRKKYYSELGGPSSDSDNFEYPVPDAYFAPTDCISLSLEFLSAGIKDEDSGSDCDDTTEKQAVHHRRYLQCPAAVNMSHLKKFLRMKYDLSPDYDVEILYGEEVLSDEFSLMDVAYTFSWNKVTPMRFQFRLIQKQRVPKVIKQFRVGTQETAKLLVRKSPELSPEETTVLKLAEEAEAKLGEEETNQKSPRVEVEGEDSNQAPDEEVTNDEKLEDEDEEQRLEEDDALVRLEEDEALEKMEEDEALERLEEDETMERLEEDEVNQRIEEEALLEEEALEEIDEDEEIEEVPEVIAPVPPVKQEAPKKPERPNGLKRPSTIDIPKQEIETKKPKLCPPPKIDIVQFKSDEKQFLEDMIIEEDTDEDRLRISASEEEKSPDPQSEVEKVFEEKPRSEEKRKKKSKKGKHHHHHRHHDRKRCDSPPSAQIVHSPENDVMKLKVKLTAIKTCDNLVKGYTVSEGIDTRKEYKEPKENGYKHIEKSVDKSEKIKHKEEDYKKKTPSPVHYISSSNSNNNNNTINSNNNNINNINSHQNSNNNSNNNNNSKSNNNSVPANQFSASALAEFARRTDEINKEKLQQQMKAIKKVVPKINGAIKTEPMKMPPSSITVSKITAAEKRQMEQQKLLMNRNQSNGVDPKRPSLEIMLVNAPKKVEAEKPEPVKKVMRPTPPSIPLSRLGKGKGSPPPLRAVRPPEEALDLSGKSSRKSPELTETLRIPLAKPAYVAAPARPCKPNPTVRQIPNPSALLFRSQALSGRALPPPALPINSLRHIETMTKKIDKVAAGLTVKAAANGLFGAK